MRKMIGMEKETIDESVLGTNPFSHLLKIDVTKRLDSKAVVKDKETGDEVPAESLIEKQKSTKLYLSAESRDSAMNLSAGTQRMLLYIMYSLDTNKDWITIVPKDYQKKAKKGTLNVYKKAIDELVRYSYLTPTLYRYVYWINPALFFSGNRITKYKDNVIIKNTWKQ